MADDLELLRRLRPERADDAYLGRGDDPTADQLLAATLAVPVRGRRRGWRPRRFFVGITVGVVLTGAGATAAVLYSKQADDPTVVLCYSRSDAAAAALVAEPSADVGPLEQCAEKWVDGTFGRSGAPQLVACVTAADVVAVIPGETATCAANGWTPAQLPAIVPAASTLMDALSDRFTDECLSDAEATALATQVLSGLDLADWQVVGAGDSASGCHFPHVDAEQRVVQIVGA